MCMHRSSGCWALAAVAVAGCATTPAGEDPAITGRQVVTLETVAFQGSQMDPFASNPGAGWGRIPGTSAPDLPGSRCVASNDRGSWEVTTPGRVTVMLSSQPLKIACRHEGFRDSAVEVRCLSPRDEALKAGAMTGMNLLASPGAAAPLVIPALLAGAAMLGTGGGGGGGGGPHGDICIYGATREVGLRFYMQRLP